MRTQLKYFVFLKQVHYKLSTINAIKKPLMIMGAFLAFFLGLIVLNRMSLKSLRSEAK